MSRMNTLLQPSPFASDGGELIGRDPRDIPAEDWQGRVFFSGLKAIRAKCLDCVYEPSEVRKCIQTDCPLWPLRMGCVPKGYRNNAIRAKMPEPSLMAHTKPGQSDLPENPDNEAKNDAEGRI